MNPFDAENSKPNYWLSCLIIDEDAMCEQVRDGTKAQYRLESGKSCPTEILEAVASLNADGSKNVGTVKAPTCQGDLFGYKSNAIDPKNGLRPQGTNFRVMSFNVQANFDSFSSAGLDRLYALRQEILFYDPNIICFQEDSKDFINKKNESGKADLSAYNVIAPSELGTSGNCSIFYKSGMTLKASGTKCLTSDGTKNTVGLTAKDVTTAGSRYQLTEEELSELGITSNTNMRNLKTSDGSSMLTSKSMTYGVFVISSREVIIVNVHLQHRSQNASYSTPAVQKIRLMERLKELSYVQAQIESLKKTYPDAEIVISGDFNDLVGSKTYLEVRDTFGYSSAHETAAARYGVSATWNNAFKLASQGNSYYPRRKARGFIHIQGAHQ
jgi:endonuclease/exonuclease/phosphatase family metal-dependent hydrolase